MSALFQTAVCQLKKERKGDIMNKPLLKFASIVAYLLSLAPVDSKIEMPKR